MIENILNYMHNLRFDCYSCKTFLIVCILQKVEAFENFWPQGNLFDVVWMNRSKIRLLGVMIATLAGIDTKFNFKKGTRDKQDLPTEK